ncbi:MAG: FAD-binding oxidoreductase [Candidatus Dormibacteraeota bacterium]|nr:FAD-binding oxidoreductase [Candidatus Dormibacteraeota bacterium]
MALTAGHVEKLSAEFSGPLVTTDDAEYDELRRVHNGLVDKRPALIARCLTPTDAAAAVRWGRESDLEISIRGGGHNVAGKAVTDGGVMIDLSLMKKTQIDSDARTITAEGGVTWRELNQAGYGHGLATTGGVVSTTGIAGLTLGGGLGWLMGKHALAVDNLISAEVVLASGDMVTASERSEPDLFWAIRGGGGNFGVVTSFEYRAYPLRTVIGGITAYPLAAAPELFRFYQNLARSVPDDLTAFFGFGHAPDGSGSKLCNLIVCHAGDDEEKAEQDVKTLHEFGPPVLDLIQRMPYPIMNTLVDEGFPRGGLNYWKSAFLTELSAEAVAKMMEAFESSPTTMCGLLVEHIHGAATRVDPRATAFPHRHPGYSFTIFSQWTDPALTAAGIGWARETLDSLRQHTADSAYVNYLAADDANRIRAAYGLNYDRLVELKRRYDPDNLFHLNQNIVP